MKSLWSELALPWQAALEEAWQSYRAGSIPIGCVIVNPTGEIIARGRNRIEQVEAPARQVCDSPLAHAELNALLALPNRLPERHECTLYTTMEPCPLCMGALYMSGVRGLAYACRDGYAGSANLLGVTPYYARKLLRVTPPQVDWLETLLLAMCFTYYLDNYPPPGIEMVETEWVKTIPHGILIGREMHSRGILAKLSESGASIFQVIRVLTTLLESFPLGDNHERFADL